MPRKSEAAMSVMAIAPLWAKRTKKSRGEMTDCSRCSNLGNRLFMCCLLRRVALLRSSYAPEPVACLVVLVVWLAALAVPVVLTWNACRHAWQERQASSKAALAAAANAALGASIAVLGTLIGLARGWG